MKDQIFISHATPEDNDFTIWLASRLEMRGYKVWIDKEGLLGGERFWQTIQNAINSSRKVLLVYSKNIVKDGFLKKGIEDEFEYAKSIAASKNDTEFIIPLHIDNSAYNLVIGLPNINHIPFVDNWAIGLAQLFKKLDKDEVKYDSDIKSTLSDWYKTAYSTDSSIISKKELYCTSWWSVKSMPNKFYMYHFYNKEQATKIRQANINTPLAQLSNIISSFDSNLSFCVNKGGQKYEIIPQHKYSFSISDILDGFESDKFPTHNDVVKYFKDYLRYLVYEILRKKGYRKTELSNKRYVYYIPKYQKFKSIKIQNKYFTKKSIKRKSLGGKYAGKGYWHYGISLLPILYPFVGVSVKSHIVFTKDGMNVIDNPSIQHSYRRNKGKNFFNEQWRDLLLALLASLQDDEGKILITVNKSGQTMEMKPWTETFWSNYGYYDPSHSMKEEDVENLSMEEDLTEELE